MLYTWHNLFKLHSVYMALTCVLKTSWYICFSKNQCWLCIAWIIGESIKKEPTLQMNTTATISCEISKHDFLSQRSSLMGRCSQLHYDIPQCFARIHSSWNTLCLKWLWYQKDINWHSVFAPVCGWNLRHLSFQNLTFLSSKRGKEESNETPW